MIIVSNSLDSDQAWQNCQALSESKLFAKVLAGKD